MFPVVPVVHRLWNSHIVSSLRDNDAADFCGELVPADCYCFRSRWFVVAIPAAEPGGNPRQPWKAALLMWVLLSFCLAFEVFSDQSHGRDEGLIDDVFG